MLGHLIIESIENQIKQGMYESEFKLIMVYLIEQEDNEKRTSEGKEKDHQYLLTRKMSDDCYTSYSFLVGIF